jgi:hypothetical protein
MVEDGIPCRRKADSRGLCGRHAIILKNAGEYEKFALPRQDRRIEYAVNPDAPVGTCRIVEEGVPCTLPAKLTGLCTRHYRNIYHRPDLKMAEFVVDRKAIRYGRQKKPVEGRCVIRELWPDGRRLVCENAAKSRGICPRHWGIYEKEPESIEHAMNPGRVQQSFALKTNPRKGICVIAENGAGCTNPARYRRQLCSRHYAALKRKGLLNDLTDRLVPQGEVTLARKPEGQVAEGYCMLTVNGVPCMNPPYVRGICGPCLHLIRSRELDYEALALPSRRTRWYALARKLPYQMVRGVCALVEDGAPCEKPAGARGLCKRHCNIAVKRGALEELGLTTTEAAALKPMLHLYLDKNVLINFAFHELFGSRGEESSVDIVRAVLRRRVRATVSLDCVRAVYSHVGHRLARPPEDGGKGMDPGPAEAEARRYTAGLFFDRNGLWNLIPYGEEQIRACARGEAFPGLSFEDALEAHLYGLARAEAVIDLFVTADAHVLQQAQGVHPAHVVATYRDQL